MARNGVSGYVLAPRMVLNILIDTVIGPIPLLGDVFDMAFKANLQHLEEHYMEGRHRGSVWKVILPVLVYLLAIIIAVLWGIYRLVAAIW